MMELVQVTSWITWCYGTVTVFFVSFFPLRTWTEETDTFSLKKKTLWKRSKWSQRDWTERVRNPPRHASMCQDHLFLFLFSTGGRQQQVDIQWDVSSRTWPNSFSSTIDTEDWKSQHILFGRGLRQMVFLKRSACISLLEVCSKFCVHYIPIYLRCSFSKHRHWVVVQLMNVRCIGLWVLCSSYKYGWWCYTVLLSHTHTTGLFIHIVQRNWCWSGR